MTLEQHLSMRKDFADKPVIWTKYIQQAKDVFDAITALKNTSIFIAAEIGREPSQKGLEILDKIIFAYDTIAKDDINLEKKYKDEIQEGLELYNKFFPN